MDLSVAKAIISPCTVLKVGGSIGQGPATEVTYLGLNQAPVFPVYTNLINYYTWMFEYLCRSEKMDVFVQPLFNDRTEEHRLHDLYIERMLSASRHRGYKDLAGWDIYTRSFVEPSIMLVDIGMRY